MNIVLATTSDPAALIAWASSWGTVTEVFVGHDTAALDIAQHAAAVEPEVVIGLPDDRVLLGAIAARLGVTIVPDVTAMMCIEPLAWARTTHAGRGELIESAVGQVVLVVEPGTLTAFAANFADEAPSTAPITHVTPSQTSLTTLSTTPNTAPAVDLHTAKTIIAIGRGVTPETLPAVRELADLLGAEIAGTRPVCEAGLLDHNRCIGQSGATVAPDLYIALGISGQIQHLTGIRHAKHIIAVNSDPDAPIFAACDTGYVGDVGDVLTQLIARLKAAE